MKNILLAVCGLSPQVITEALYALHQEGRCVDEVYVITTRQGKDIINAQLLSPADGQYYQYLRDYRIEAGQIAFGPDHVQVIVDERGREIPDILEADDNEQFLKKCLELTFSLTRDEETAVFFLVAGGRKTMSSCLTLAAQLYGRPQDRTIPFWSCGKSIAQALPTPVNLATTVSLPQAKLWMNKTSLLHSIAGLRPIPLGYSSE